MLPLAPALEKIRDPDIELLNVVQVIPGKILGTEEGDELRIRPERGIGPQIGRNFLSLVLKNQGPRGFEGMVMRQRQIDGLVETDEGRTLAGCGPRGQQEKHQR